jgi:hypothetical protein
MTIPMSDDEIEGARRFTERCLRLEREALFPDLVAAARDIADYYSRSVNVGPGLHPTRETLLWANLRRVLARVEEAGL